MIWIALFARSRRWLFNAIVAVLCGLLIVLAGPLSYAINPQAGYLVAVSAQIPLLSAISVQASLSTPLYVQESQAVSRIAGWRLVHIVVLTSLAAAIVAVAAVYVQPPPEALANGFVPIGPVALARNMFALTGAALAGGAIFGSSFGWVLPLAWSILPYLVLSRLDADPSGVLTLIMQPDDAFLPFVFAVVLWAAGAYLGVRPSTLRRLAGRARSSWVVRRAR